MSYSFEELKVRSQQIRRLHTIANYNDWVLDVAFSPDGQWLASTSTDSLIRLWEVQTGRQLQTLEGHSAFAYIHSVTFSPDGQWLASAAGHRDNNVRLWHVATERQARSLAHEGLVLSVDFSPDGRWLASGSADNAIRLWDVNSGNEIHILTGHTDWVNSVGFSSDGRWLASGSEDHSVRMWEIETMRQVKTLTSHTRGVTRVIFSPNGHWLASSSADGTVRLLDTKTDHQILLARHPARVIDLVWSPDSTLLITHPNCAIDSAHLWHIISGQAINVLPKMDALDSPAPTGPLGIVSALAISCDGRYLTTYPSHTINAIQLWDISALGVGPKPKPQPNFSTDLHAPLRTHLRTWSLAHVAASHVPPDRPAAWLRGGAAAGWPLPLALARDLGLLLSQAGDQLTLAKPPHLPYDEDTSAYLAFLGRVAAHPLARELPAWQPPLSDAVLAVVLARLVEGLDLPNVYRPPTGPAGVVFTRALAAELETADPAQIWRDTPPEARPHWEELLPPPALARIEANLQGLDREELRFLARYGPPLTGSPDPRDLLDMLSLTGLPEMARLALSQTLKLLPRVSAARTVGGVQTYPEGGYEGLARKGSLDSLLLTELAYPEDVFLHRFFNHEALYYGRERPRERRRELAYIVTQTGWGLGGDGEVLARALTLALAQAMRQRDYEVLYSLAGTGLSEPGPLDKPGQVARMLYQREQARVDEEVVLKGVLEHLRGWRDAYRGRQVLWVLSEFFDADCWEEHEVLYHTLRVEGGQQAWFVRVGKTGKDGNGRRRTPPAARFFESWQVLETGLMWEAQAQPPGLGRFPSQAEEK